MGGAAFEMRSVSKRFGSIEALADANLSARPGEVHALLGENGAGKTTLMRVLCGALRPDGGEVLVEGRGLRPGGTRAAATAGIGMVHQHFTLVPSLTVAENVALGTREGSGLRLALDRVHARLAELERVTGLLVDPGAAVAGLSVGAKQRVEILKALYRDPRVLVLDEPTTVLGPQEVDWLFGVLRSLVEEGRTVLLIGHKLDEILRVADRVTVLRRGRTVLAEGREAVDAPGLARAMIGRETTPAARSIRGVAGERVARLKAVGALGEDGRLAVRDVTLEVHRGEIVGIAGVEGNGQAELVNAIIGIQDPDQGVITLLGRDITHVSVRHRREMGLGYVPQDRHRDGLLLGFTLWENAALGHQTEKPYSRGPWLSRLGMRGRANRIKEDFDVRTPNIEVSAHALSGGNQQKLIVGREMVADPAVLIANHPTRGIDVGAQAAVWDDIRDARSRGLATLLVSADLDELIGLSDTIVVMLRGRLVARLDPNDVTPRDLGAYMTGAALEAGAP